MADAFSAADRQSDNCGFERLGRTSVNEDVEEIRPLPHQLSRGFAESHMRTSPLTMRYLTFGGIYGLYS
ncbi:hypothetical protein K443DRAFT_684205 [Laccaria amethystina LaAM-08-1]|uniref:Uncharacterized protein n=1 Tax=Laccaria amethystina LaAM-08-1 TaxID=1095629 RepID=A0A0C9WY17_9AGAR|nr:hypothetical protein K443DRAFT_684205 [Laccaria amethystina LaAM-08-1]